MLTVVLGGARSGKSRYAETLITVLPPPWRYIATAEPFDEEMIARIAAHRTRRGDGWITLEIPKNLSEILAADCDKPSIVDCLTLWLSNLLLADVDIESEITRLEEVLRKPAAERVLVSNEVGFGIVPDSVLGRRFRDLQGELNRRVADLADRVVLMVAGVPLIIKD
jgi:adenosylcobinamide kinase/adenosylcobinamide-phosphate guanylyltransferase